MSRKKNRSGERFTDYLRRRLGNEALLEVYVEPGGYRASITPTVVDVERLRTQDYERMEEWLNDFFGEFIAQLESLPLKGR